MSKKVTIEFTLEDPEEELRLKRTLNADNAYLALWAIAQEVFRPARKHGYPDSKLQQLLEGTLLADELIATLEQKFYKILETYGVDLDDLH